jgi:hypothetical protein
MATTASKGIGAQFDKIILVVFILALVGSLAYMFTAGGGFGYRGEGSGSLSGKKAEPMDFKVMSNEWSRLSSLVAFTQTNRVLTSEDRIQCLNTNEALHYISAGYEDKNCPVCNFKVVINLDFDKDGLLDTWEEVYGLDRTKADDAGYDSDKDGYTNLEEFMAIPKTHPKDSARHPPHLDALRTLRVDDQPMFFLLKAINQVGENDYRFQLSIQGRPAVFAKLDEVVQGWKLAKYDGATQILTIKRGTQEFNLPRRKQVQIPQRKAIIGVITDPSFIKQVAKGDPIELEARKYKVVDIEANSVLLTDVAGEKLVVPKASAEEIEKLKSIKAGNFPGP